MRSGRTAESPLKLRLSVISNLTSNGLFLDVFDRLGNNIDRTQIWTSTEPNLLNGDQIAKEVIEDGHGQWITITDETAAAAKFQPSRVKPGMPKWFLAPDREEPLQVIAGNLTASLCQELKGICAVAVIPDEWFELVRPCIVKDKLNVTAFKKVLDVLCPTEVTQGSLAVIRPVDPESVERHRTDRLRLTLYRKFAGADGAVSFRLASKATHEDYPKRWHWTNWIAGPAGNSVQSEGDVTPKIKTLIGGISDSDWERLEAGQN